MGTLLQASRRYCQELAQSRTLSDNSLKAYEGDVSQFVDYAQTQRVEQSAELDTELCRSWVWSLAESGVAASSLRRKVSSLKGFTHWLGLQGNTKGDVGGAGSWRQKPNSLYPGWLTRSTWKKS